MPCRWLKLFPPISGSQATADAELPRINHYATETNANCYNDPRSSVLNSGFFLSVDETSNISFNRTDWSWNQIDNSVINISHGELNSTTLNNCYQRQIVHNKVNIEWDLCFVDIAPALDTIEHCDVIYWVIFHLKHFRHDKDTTRRLKVLLNFSNITKCSTDDSWQYFQPVSSTWFSWCIYCS